MRTKDKELFEHWLFEMDDALERFMERLPADVSSALDYSTSSLSPLEGWLLRRFESPEHALSDDGADDLDAASRYVGEVLRKAGNGKWRIPLEDEDYAFYGIPEVCELGSRSAPPVCPMSLVSAATDRRSGRYLSTTIGYFLEDHL